MTTTNTALYATAVAQRAERRTWTYVRHTVETESTRLPYAGHADARCLTESVDGRCLCR